MENKKTILISGGSGKLGSRLRLLDSLIIAPSRVEMDILDKNALELAIDKYKPDIFIHCAAFIGPIECERNPIEAMRTNIEATCNVTAICHEKGVRLVYISTDYVFKGDKGNYSENDEVLPQNLYAWSKLGGETAVRMYPGSLIIRTSFSPDVFPYDKAFVDQYTSRDSLSVIAPMILELSKGDVRGVIHVGTEKKTVKELALKLGKHDVGEISIKEVTFNPPQDASFNLAKLNKILKK